MRRTKKLNSKNSKSKRANKKKNVRISKKKVGGGVRKSMTPGRPIPGTLALPRHLPFERAGKAGVKPEGFLERKERERRERERAAIARERRERERLRKLIINQAAYRYSSTLGGNPSDLNADENYVRAKVALENLLEISLEYHVIKDNGALWIKFLRSARFKRRPGKILLNTEILKHLKRLFYVLEPHYKGVIKQFLVGPAQTGDFIYFTDMGFMADGKAFPTWLLEQLEGNLEFVRGTSVYQESPV